MKLHGERSTNLETSWQSISFYGMEKKRSHSVWQWLSSWLYCFLFDHRRGNDKDCKLWKKAALPALNALSVVAIETCSHIKCVINSSLTCVSCLSFPFLGGGSWKLTNMSTQFRRKCWNCSSVDCNENRRSMPVNCFCFWSGSYFQSNLLD